MSYLSTLKNISKYRRRISIPGGMDLDAYTKFQQERGKIFLKNIGKRMDFSGKKILDMGCGPGGISSLMTGMGAEVVAIDTDRSLIAAAKKKFPGVDIRVGDATNTGLSAESFDAITAICMLDHMPLEAQKRLAKEVARLLKPGGSLFLTTNLQGSILAGLLKIDQNIHEFKDENPVTFKTVLSMFSDLKLVGVTSAWLGWNPIALIPVLRDRLMLTPIFEFKKPEAAK